MFIRRKCGLLFKVVPFLAVAGVAQTFMKRRGQRAGMIRKLIGTASLAAIAMQKAGSRSSRSW